MSIDAASVLDYLHEHIPLSRDMGVRVLSCGGEAVTLGVPLEPNLNHESNAFGGSISALATLTGWTLLYVRLRALAPPGRIVIQRSQVEYRFPIETAFHARTLPVETRDWDRMVETLRRRRRARITIGCEILSGETVCARFEGVYVVLD